MLPCTATPTDAIERRSQNAKGPGLPGPFARIVMTVQVAAIRGDQPSADSIDSRRTATDAVG
jgi:hypothetical protein